MDVDVRVVSGDDAAALTELLCRNRAFLAPWEPVRDDAFFTEMRQRAEIDQALERYHAGTALPCVIRADGEIAGRITLSTIVRGPFESANLGYWVGERVNGRGVATAAVAAVLERAFSELGLHRVQAATLLHNGASRRVLARNGFTEIGTAPRYLRIAGRWQDHLLHQRIHDGA